MTAWRHIFLVTDLEGVAGVDSWEQTRGMGSRHEEATALATDEVNSVVRRCWRGAKMLITWHPEFLCGTGTVMAALSLIALTSA